MLTRMSCPVLFPQQRYDWLCSSAAEDIENEAGFIRDLQLSAAGDGIQNACSDEPSPVLFLAVR